MQNNNEEPQLSFGEAQGGVMSLASLLEETPTVESPIVEQEIDIPLLEKEKEEEQTPPLIIPPAAPPKEADVFEAPTTKFKELYNQLVATGEWKEIESVETEEGEKALDDVEFSEDLFKEISRQQREAQREELLKDKISLDGLPDVTRKFIEIQKNGGNLAEAMQVYQGVQEPLDRLDIDTEEGQVSAITMSLLANKVPEDTIPFIIEGYKVKGILEDKALESKEALSEAVTAHLEKINNDALAMEQARLQNLNAFKKELKAQVTTQFQVTEPIVKSLVDLTTKKEDGVYGIDKLYNEARRSPEQSAELAFFLSNKEEYLKQKFNKAMTEEKTKTMFKLNLAKSAGQKGSLNITQQRGHQGDEISLDEINRK